MEGGIPTRKPGSHMTVGLGILWFETFVVSPDEVSARGARDFVSANLASHDLLPLVDDVRLVVSELVTNALLHARPPVIVNIQEHRVDVLVTVSDASAVLPVALPSEATALNGRGVFIVDQVSSEWGANPRVDGGKTVWARFLKDRYVAVPTIDLRARPA